MASRTFIAVGVAVLLVGGGYGAARYLDLLPTGGQAGKTVSAANGAGGQQAGRQSRGRRGRTGPVPVLIGAVEQRSTPELLTAIGSATAVATVAVKSRIDGQLFRAQFTEGQMVREGEPLFQIDPRPFQVQLRQAQANLARDRAQVQKLKSDLDRYGKLAGKGFASQQKYDEARAAYAAIQATLKADEAAIEAVKLQLDYTVIRSPIEGRTGSILVNPGNLIKANDSNPLVVITKVRPVDVTFSVPERYLARIKALMAAGTATVSARIPDNPGPARTGRLAFVNNTVDSATGTIQLKAQFPNADDGLTPGQFVNVALTLRERPEALVVPSQAVQDGQRGQFVFVVRENSTAEMRPVEIDDIVGDVTVIRKGLAPGERVVLDGQLQLRPGAKVVERKPGATGPPGQRRRGAGRGERPNAEARVEGNGKRRRGKEGG